MGPPPRDCGDFKSKPVGEEEKLGIEAPALDPLPGKDGIGGAAGEGLESALRIFLLEIENNSERQVEDASEKLAMKRLLLNLQCSIHPAGANGHFRSVFQGGEEFACLIDWRGKIGIAEQQNVALSVQHAVAHAVSFAAIAGVFHQLHGRVTLRPLAHNFGGIIARAVVDHKDFGLPSLLGGMRQNLLQGRSDAGGFVVGRNDDAVFHEFVLVFIHPRHRRLDWWKSFKHQVSSFEQKMSTWIWFRTDSEVLSMAFA